MSLRYLSDLAIGLADVLFEALLGWIWRSAPNAEQARQRNRRHGRTLLRAMAAVALIVCGFALLAQGMSVAGIEAGGKASEWLAPLAWFCLGAITGIALRSCREAAGRLVGRGVLIRTGAAAPGWRKLHQWWAT